MLTKTDSNGVTGYSWDYENRLTSVTLPGTGGTVTFRYDPFGRRIQKSGLAGITNYLYDGANVVADLNSTGAVLARYAQGAGVDEPLAATLGGTLAFYEADGLGSITSMTNSGGSAVGAYTTDAFGKAVSTADTLGNRFRYTAREWDSETGLYYYRARYYSPDSGRFLNEDPIAFRGGINFYTYVNNNSINLIDPSGNAPCLDINQFVHALDSNALPAYGKGRCGRHVGVALAAGGLNVGSHNGKDYGPYLLDAGFSEVSPNGYQPRSGDVVVFQPYSGGSPYGHVQGFDGTNWVSDFIQPYPATAPGGIYPGAGYRNRKPPYVIYRPTPCPTSPAEEG
jgi:RHS repeat-associated protein